MCVNVLCSVFVSFVLLQMAHSAHHLWWSRPTKQMEKREIRIQNNFSTHSRTSARDIHTKSPDCSNDTNPNNPEFRWCSFSLSSLLLLLFWPTLSTLLHHNYNFLHFFAACFSSVKIQIFIFFLFSTYFCVFFRYANEILFSFAFLFLLISFLSLSDFFGSAVFRCSKTSAWNRLRFRCTRKLIGAIYLSRCFIITGCCYRNHSGTFSGLWRNSLHCVGLRTAIIFIYIYQVDADRVFFSGFYFYFIFSASE